MSSRPEGSKNKLFGRAPLVGFAVFVILMAGLVVDANKPTDDNFYSDIIRLDNVTTKIHQSYVEEIKSKDLVDKAVEGMLQILDPHSSYFDVKQYEELRIHTEGKFGGLGIQIAIRDKVLTVMTPISGTPASRAGIQSGDQIIKINGKSTRGITIDAAVGKLRGTPGSEVAVTIRRRGESKDLEFTLTREVIQIHAVPFYGVMENGIGYVELRTFSEDAGPEVEKAIRELLKKDIKGLVLDLRMNPGGLLPQAIEVSEKFLPRKTLVVSTRGRQRGQNKEFYSDAPPVLPEGLPLTVLVTPASASASEIVAGAIQDWDRGLVLGDTTFGKGSVQSILPLDPSHHLKLTTAFYYTPSGRCINKPENGIRGVKNDTADAEESDSTEVADSSETSSKSKAKTDTTTYRTKNGRIVYGGGGIVPDTIVHLKEPSQVIMELVAKDAMFKFANMMYPRLKERKIKIDKDYKVDDKIIKEFYTFLDDTIQFKYTTMAKLRFDDFKYRAGLRDTAYARQLASRSAERKPVKKGSDTTAADTIVWPTTEEIGITWSSDETAQLDKIAKQIDDLLASAGKRTIVEHDQEIRKFLSQAMQVREFGQDNEIVFRKQLSEDLQLKAAIAIMSDRKLYDKFLNVKK